MQLSRRTSTLFTSGDHTQLSAIQNKKPTYTPKAFMGLVTNLQQCARELNSGGSNEGVWTAAAVERALWAADCCSSSNDTVGDAREQPPPAKRAKKAGNDG